MTSQEIIDAIFYLVPNAEFTFTETDLSTLQWHTEGVKKPTLAEINAAIPLAKDKIRLDKIALENKKTAVLAQLGISAEDLAAALS